MPIRADIEELPAVNLTPMIDVVFLLIIFFLVGTKFYELEREISVQLPETSDARPLTKPPQEIIINVSRDGQITVDQVVLSAERLVGVLQQARTRYPDQSVLVRGDRDAKHQMVVTVLGACVRAGIHRMSVATLEPH